MRAPNAAATAATHPAMEIFRLPAEKETSVTEDADELRRRAKGLGNEIEFKENF